MNQILGPTSASFMFQLGKHDSNKHLLGILLVPLGMAL